MREDSVLPLVCSKLPVTQGLSSSFHLDLSSSITRFQSFIFGLASSQGQRDKSGMQLF